MYVLILNTGVKTPTFHAPREYHGVLLDFRSDCGVVAWGHLSKAILPLRHAEKFAQPCGRCFTTEEISS